MKPSIQYVTTLQLIKSLRERGSWCGETHLQKSMFFLERLAEVPADLGFILYKHGPYSFEFTDVLGDMKTDGLIEYVYNPPYGPQIKLTEAGKARLNSDKESISTWTDNIQKVTQCLASKGVVELEKLGTALLVRNEAPNLDGKSRAKRLSELKPHIDLEEAEVATRELDEKIIPCFS